MYLVYIEATFIFDRYVFVMANKQQLVNLPKMKHSMLIHTCKCLEKVLTRVIDKKKVCE